MNVCASSDKAKAKLAAQAFRTCSALGRVPGIRGISQIRGFCGHTLEDGVLDATQASQEKEKGLRERA